MPRRLDVRRLLLLIFGLVGSVAFVFPVSLLAQTIQVRHDHDPWGGCEGQLEITEDGIRYETDEEDHRRSWNWIDIQGFDRHSAERFSLITYEDLGWHLGLDRAMDFAVLPGEAGLGDADFAFIEGRLIRPATDRVARVVEPEYEIAAKHLHVFGGCEGTLAFGEEWIVFDTDHAEDVRSWRRQDIANVWSSNEFELELSVFEENRRAFDKTTRFTFQLKEPLDSEYYDSLRREYLLSR